jgi:hypothetical protein
MSAVAPDFARLRWGAWEARLQSWTKEFPSLVRLGTLGKTRQGRKIPLIQVGHAPIEAMVLTGVHPREQSPPVVVATWLEELMRTDAPILTQRTIYWVPFLNVDGKIRDDEGGERGSDIRKNAAGVDLNRNFSVRWGGGRAFDPAWNGSTDDPKTGIYEGPSALSEPETHSLVRFWEKHPNLRALLDVHNPLREMLCPAFAPASEQKHLQGMLDAMAARQKTPYATTKLDVNSEPKVGTRAGNSGLGYTHAYYLQGIFGFNFELSTPDRDRGRSGRYPEPAEILAEYEPNLKGPLDVFLERAESLPLAGKGRLRLPGDGTLDGPLAPGAPVGWLPPQIEGDAPCERAILISESRDIVVQSEYRNWPVATPFTLELQPTARRGQKLPLTLILWDAERRRSVHRFALRVQ